MKKILLYSLTGLALLSCLCACSEDDKYSTSVVKQVNLFLDDKPVEARVGIKSWPLFIYKDNGEYFANYMFQYRFQLPNGNYKALACYNPDSISPLKKLDEIVIKQDPAAKTRVVASAPVNYASPFNEALNLHMYTRSGVLRLKATDKKADKSYSIVRAVISTPISGYQLSNAQYIETPTEVIRDQPTATGGVNYTDDMILFETQTIGKDVSVRIDYLDNNKTVVQSKIIDGSFAILPNDTVQVSFALNNEDEPMIQDYTVTVASEGWSEEEINPQPPLRIPDGYTLVSDGENINTFFNAQKNDPNVDEVKLFLRTGSTYTINRGVLAGIFKGFHFVGEKPVNGGEPARLIINSAMTPGTTAEKAMIDNIHFENLIIEDHARVFEFKKQLCEVNTISFVNCEFPNWGTVPLWYQQASDYNQIIHNFIFDNCRILNIDEGFLTISNKAIVPIYNIVFKNSTFHMKRLVGSLIGNLNRVPDNLSVTVENCTIVNMGPGNVTLFNLDGASATNFTATLKNNLFSGVESGLGNWLVLKNVTASNVSGNYRTKGFEINGSGFNEALKELDVTMDDLFMDASGSNLTIKDKASIVYTQKIGDPHWIK